MPSPVASVHQPSAPAPALASVTQSSSDAQKEKKLSVLESHGYYLGKTIGTGSYATVRVAHSERHEGDVAIKIVSKFSAPADYLKKFLPREIEVVKGLRHPNLIRFLQAIETTHRVYIVMEYAENGSLLDIIRKDQYIDEPRARKWFKQLVSAVEYCHERGVVHRDIKCENMLMDVDWNVKLSDFGFAKGHVKPKNGQTILSETYCGSYAYASPEILRGIPYQPQYADVWSMGVVLYAMVFGRLPFDDSNYKELLKQVSNKVSFPKDPKVSGNCRALINKILAPLKSRIRITGIRNDAWFNFDSPSMSDMCVKEKKDTTASESEGQDRKVSGGSKELVVPYLITKEQLEANAKVREKSKRDSTDEEVSIKTQEPKLSDEQGAVARKPSPGSIKNKKIENKK
ncbi:testis-specific serine/threonine-protein kinase 3-like [Anoplophora glabripennis]|uniref:testis-specific serine/threonine-protein kinase 3-like n=1 Tax=Anoplophora glabripennis TaxID=217634 RepID=UPI000C77B8E7|nr:testis-specific serine/threonine-protein kinase 3-like [Anoplophora glabripennis]